MSARTIEISRLTDDEWTVDGERVTVPEGRAAQAFLLTYASERYPAGTVAMLPTAEGGTRNVTLRHRTGAKTPNPPTPAPTAAPTVAAPTTAEDLTDQLDTSPQPRRTGRALVVALVILALLLALAAALILPRLAGPAPENQEPAGWRQAWEAAPTSGPITAAATQVAGAGVILNVDGGAAEAYRQDDGGFIGSALAPEGTRIGVGPEFVVLATSTEGTSSGAVITPNGVTPFSEEPGALIRRGSVPFLAGGTGAEQFALVYRNSEWARVDAPTPGLAPLAVTESSVVWLGTGRAITLTDYSGSVTSESTLKTPEGAAEATQRAFVTDSLIGVVWTGEDGDRELVTHSPTTGEILESVPVAVEVFDKTGAAITSTADGEESNDSSVMRRYWTLSGNTPENPAAPCADPIPSGGTAWCAEGDTFTDSNGESLPAGTRPIPSTTDTTPAISGDQLALYSR